MEKDSSKFTNAFNRFEEWRNNVGKTASGKIGEESYSERHKLTTA